MEADESTRGSIGLLEIMFRNCAEIPLSQYKAYRSFPAIIDVKIRRFSSAYFRISSPSF